MSVRNPYFKEFGKDIWILSAGWFVSILGFSISIPFISIYFQNEYALSLTKIGLFFAVMAVIRVAFQGAGGELSDRLGRKELLVYSQMFRAATLFSLAFAVHLKLGFWVIGTMLLINAAFGSLFQPAANALVSDILPEERQLDGYAFVRSAGNLGWAVGPLFGGLILASSSYAWLFALSALMTLISGLFLARLAVTNQAAAAESRLRDFLVIKDDPYLATHTVLIFLLYLVVSQLIAPFSIYAVNMVGISKTQLGFLYTLNGLLVVVLQVPVTRILTRYKFTTQLASGAFLYAAGYTVVGVAPDFTYFIAAIIIVTMGEIFMSPPSLALTARLAPDGKSGRYMGIIGFSIASGWSLGPLYGGVILDRFGKDPLIAWSLISSLALVSGIGYLYLKEKLPDNLNTSNCPRKKLDCTKTRRMPDL